jgi:hypothetical protein
MTAPSQRWAPIVVHLTPHAARLIARVARIWVAAAIAWLTVLAVTVGVPIDPSGGALSPAYAEPIQYGLLAMEAAALLLSRRFHTLELIVLTLGGGALALFAAYEYQPFIALTIGAAFLLPAVLLWVAWHPTETLGAVIALGVSTAAVIAFTFVGVNAVNASVFGPTHPDSTTPPVAGSLTDWMWSGEVTDSGFSVVVGGIDHRPSRLLVVPSDGSGDFTGEGVRAFPPVWAGDEPARFRTFGLEPATRYRYAVEVEGTVDTARVGGARTFPRGAGDLTVAVASCARTGSNGTVYDAIRAADPDLYVITGDVHYDNIEQDSYGLYDRAYRAFLTAPSQAALYQEVPVAYVWDDHDFGGNDSDRTASSGAVARLAYERFVPAYDLDGTTINQAFTAGRVRFILTDTRSARDPITAPAVRRSMLGPGQLEWLEAELTASSPTHALVVWVNPTPWIADSGDDTWAGYARERQELSEHIVAAGIDNLVMLSGDAHMVAIDDGTNNDFAASGGPGFPVLHAAALDRPGSEKGGPYSEGAFPGGGQFGLMHVHDDGGDVIEVRLQGFDHTGAALTELTFQVAVPAGAA